MAGGSLLALLDDITLIMDDVGAMTKVAATKTSGVLGDDLALNAEQVSGVPAERELPVVWAVAKGSFINKCILVPLALALSAFAPAWALTALLMVGGAYLCFEGFEKLAHKFLHSEKEDQIHHDELIHAVEDEQVDMVQFEKDKIKGAIRTDFVLSDHLGHCGGRSNAICTAIGGVVCDWRGHDRGCVWFGRCDCEAGRHGVLFVGFERRQKRGFTKIGCIFAVVCTAFDENIDRGRYRRHVHGGWRHHHARRAIVAPLD